MSNVFLILTYTELCVLSTNEFMITWAETTQTMFYFHHAQQEIALKC